MKTGTKCCSRSTNEAVSSMGRLPCLGAYLVCLAQTGCQNRARKPTANCRNATLAAQPASEREAAESGINVYANDPREMCET